ncbi:MAG: helix-turn-helix transcriptional regulator [Clostridia bacterium]|nr:helix-turn-helix transcriptional regulator [Clostridia bacterium]
MKLGENIRLYRTKLNLTQEALGEAVGVSAQAVSKWESYSSLPDTALLPGIAAALNVSVDALFGIVPGSQQTMLESMYAYHHQTPTDHRTQVQNAWEMAFHGFMSAIWQYAPENIQAMPSRSVQIQWDEGFGQGWYYPESPAFVMTPRPADGWERVLADDAQIRTIFGALADEEVWKAVLWLMTHKPFYRFLFPVLLRDTGIPTESEEKVKAALLKLRLVYEQNIIIDSKPEIMYQYYPKMEITALWIQVYNFLYHNNGFDWQQQNLQEPILKSNA